MHLLYVDESGCAADISQKYFVLAGVAVFERKTHWIEQQLNEIAARFSPSESHNLELHGSPMRSGREGWKAFALPERLQAIKDALRLGVAQHYPNGVRLFAAVIKKENHPKEDHVMHAFEHLTNRFDCFLRRLHKRHNNKQRGLILFDESSTERRIQTLAREFKYDGHSWGKTSNYAEVPVFLNSRASRLVQLADLIAYALFRSYEHGDNSFYAVIEQCFDCHNGVRHGLYVSDR